MGRVVVIGDRQHWHAPLKIQSVTFQGSHDSPVHVPLFQSNTIYTQPNHPTGSSSQEPFTTGHLYPLNSLAVETTILA